MAAVADRVDELDIAWDEVRAELRGFVARRLADPHAVEDLVQDVLVRVLTAASGGGEIRNLSAWLHRVARNAVIDHYRGRRPWETLERATATTDPSPWPADGESDDRSRELARCLRPLIDRLPPGDGEALVLTDLDGMTQAAAAATLGLSVSGMKSRVQRARRRLRDLLVDCCPVEVDRRGGIIDFVHPAQPCECVDPQTGHPD
jgi:RNA polymerase sigma-70 factor, ECF subfamily